MDGHAAGSPRKPLETHPELWEALGRGARLRTILEAFYRKVYADPRLSPFFAQTTFEWAVDHQYTFLGQILSGEPMFFGDRPRNAHHWMVIDDALFDYREALMMETLAEHGLTEAQRDEWRSIEEAFRSHIVKDRAFPKKRRGEALPLKGFEPLELSCGSLCDGCGAELAVGSRIDYHLRTGKLYCADCIDDARARDTLRPAAVSGEP